jgi:predicted ribosome quality control (RQC) complex YloA/Tae2 family protein
MFFKGFVNAAFLVRASRPLHTPTLTHTLTHTPQCRSFTTDTPRGVDSAECGSAREEWSLTHLNKEVSRQQYRTVKKLTTIAAKDTQTHSHTHSHTHSLTLDSSLLNKQEKLSKRLQQLITLENQLKHITSLTHSDPHYDDIMQQVSELQLHNPKAKPSLTSSLTRQSKKPKKPLPRLIYYPYVSEDNIPIHVGRQATDNDVLSCSSEYRDDNEWWLHAAGCPGSHVIIKCSDDNITRNYPDTVSDAALLAAHRSKNKSMRTCDVKLTRCKNVKKIPGTPAGQVLLMSVCGSGVKTITVNMKKSRVRFEALERERLSRI